MGSGKKGGTKKYWYDYYLSFHLGFCAGPVDALTKLTMNEKEVWSGDMPANGVLGINQPNLFGGNEREGGAFGLCHVMLGGVDQVSPEALAIRVGRTPETMTGYRLLSSLVFTGLAAYEGFNVGSNYPSVPTVAARWRRGSYTLDAPGGQIRNSKGLLDSNPAHMLYELFCGENDWGMGGSPNALDTSSFTSAAATLFNENFGLSILWTKQTTIEAFAQEILDHIQGMFFFNPATGKGTLKLIRGDYDPNALETIGPNDCVLNTFRRKLWGETVNEVTIEYTNTDTEESDTLTYQDLGNIAMQGQKVNQSSNYYGIRTDDLAAFVGARDITAASQPLASAEITVDRRRWKLLPGDVFKFSYPKYGIDSVIMRVMEVDYGTFANSKMTLQLIEDVHGLSRGRFVQLPPPTKWEDPAQNPDTGNGGNMDPNVFFMAATYPLIVQEAGEPSNPDDQFPEILICPLVTPAQGQDDIQAYKLWQTGTNPDGTTGYFEAGEKTLTGNRNFAGSVGKEVQSTIIIDPSLIRGRTGPQVGGIAVIYISPTEPIYPGDEIRMEAWSEIILCLQDLGGNAWRVARGIWDTVPRAWGSNANIWFLDSNWYSIDTSADPADADIDYKIQPRTSKGLRNLDLCPDRITNRPARPYMPFRPANCSIDGHSFEGADHSKEYNPRNWVLFFAWSTRNRLMEDTIYRQWNEANVPPEEGQTTHLLMSFGGSAPRRRIAGLVGDSLTVNVMDTGREQGWTTKFLAHRNDLDSIQGIEIPMALYKKGYGSDWGYFWGGWPEESTIGVEES